MRIGCAEPSAICVNSTQERMQATSRKPVVSTPRSATRLPNAATAPARGGHRGDDRHARVNHDHAPHGRGRMVSLAEGDHIRLAGGLVSQKARDAGDQEAEQRQKDNCRSHLLSPSSR